MGNQMTLPENASGKVKGTGVQTKLLLTVIPLFVLSFLILVGITFINSSRMVMDSAKQTLLNEADSNAKAVTINLLSSTGCSSIHAAYVRLNLRPADVEQLCRDVAKMTVLDSGYVFLVDSETGEILAHADESLRHTFLTDYAPDTFFGSIAAYVAEGNAEVNTAANTDGNYYTVATFIEETPWILVSCISENYIMSDLAKLLENTLILFALILLVVIIIVSAAIQHMIKPVRKLTKALAQIADGDFTVKIKSGSRDEIGRMSRALQDFLSILKEIISDIRSVSNQLSASSSQTKNVASALNSASESQAESMGDMKITLNQVAHSIQELSHHAATLSNIVTSTNENGRRARENMHKTVDVASHGRADMETVGSTMTSIVSAMKNLKEIVENVSVSAEKISSMVSLISDIAEQTNLLSLNASIEAARAGDSGRGFAVVAEEIGKLAFVSASSASQITDTIKEVSSQVSVMAEQTARSVAYIEDNSVKITSACDIFEHIYHDVNETNVILNEIVEQIVQVDDVANNIAALSQEQSAGTEEILASTEVLAENALQFTTDSGEVSKNAEDVSAASFILEEHMRRFKI